MTEDDRSRVSLSESADYSSNTKQRKKRKWDQPAESLVSAGLAVPGILPLGNMGGFIGPGSTACYGNLQQVLMAQKIQPKIQEELIAREIVINDAESSVRYRLTKRQTQEEIQMSTGAIVITRGKYRPPNAPSDGEKPLYLHISAGTHLETTADRIKAVDQAAAMVEEILKQGPLTNGLKAVQPFSTCVFLGFEPDPSLNITARIRGPNDQYVNHIMNETGSKVLLRGRGSGNLTTNAEEQQPLHLFLSSGNPKSLEHAKLLAENLLDTICAECGASRVSSVKVYGAVPPPPNLSLGVQNPAIEATAKVTVSSAPLTAGFGQPPASVVTYPVASHGTSYNGYGGIYPQATPLQQVALALKQVTSPITSTVSATQKNGNPTASTVPEKEKQPVHKRKFQEGPVKTHQVPGILNPSEAKPSIPPPKKPVQSASNGMLPPPPRTMPPPPPPPQPPSRTVVPTPPKFDSSTTEVKNASKPETKSVPETLVSLMAYGDEDDDDDEETPAVTKGSKSLSGSKPFWAV